MQSYTKLTKHKFITKWMTFLQDTNEDTEWNDILRAKGIIPAKEPEVSEEALAEMIEQTIQEKQSVGGLRN